MRTSEEKKAYRDRLVFLSGMLILFYICVTVLFSSVIFLVGGKISVLTSVSCIVLSIVFFAMLTQNEGEGHAPISLIIGVGIVLVALFVCDRIYDFTYDGNWYHKVAVGCMANGWNPLYEALTDFGEANRIQFLGTSAVWVEHYCKASWIFGANIYVLTGSIETAKCMSLLLVYSLFAFAYYYLSSRRFTRTQSLLIAAVLSLSPVTTSQLFTFYVDNLLFTSLYGVIICLIWISDQVDMHDRLYVFTGLSCFIIICTNVKFTGFAYAAMFCFAFYVVWLITACRKRKFKAVFAQTTIYFVAIVLISVVMVGSSSYVTNFIDHGHVFYPLFGEGKIDIITNNQPAVFKDMPGLEKLYYALFSESANIWGDKAPVLKELFSCEADEILAVNNSADLRIGGFGPFFGIVIILSAVVVLASLVILFIKNKKWCAIVGAMLLTSIALILIIQDGWWARYSPYMYLIPVVALALAIVIGNQIPQWYLKVIPTFFAVIISVLALFHTSLSYNYVENALVKTLETREALQEAAERSQEGKIEVCLPDVSLHGVQFNIRDFDIDCEIIPGSIPYAQPLYQYFVLQTPDAAQP